MLHKETARYREKHNIYLTILYYFAVICLILIVACMYKGWKKRKQQFEQVVQAAALQDQAIVMEPRTVDDFSHEEDDPLK